MCIILYSVIFSQHLSPKQLHKHPFAPASNTLPSQASPAGPLNPSTSLPRVCTAPPRSLHALTHGGLTDTDVGVLQTLGGATAPGGKATASAPVAHAARGQQGSSSG